MRNVRRLVALLGVVSVGVTVGEHEAKACGGSFLPPAETETVTTDHRMILSISQDQTTLYDQIEYKGSPSSFAWVLPIKGTVTIGLSADVLFDTLDSLTTTEVLEPATGCPAAPDCFNGGEFAAATASADAGAGGGSVTVTQQQQVGPYETVQLHSTDPGALNSWLTGHGYTVPSSAAPVISGYVSDGFDFLAMKLVPGRGVQAMRPVRVTSSGASAVLPLRMVAVGTGATTGITLWVVADGRWEPQNFPFFTLKDSQIAWDWATNSSNYETLRLSTEASYGGKGWQVESSLELNQYTIGGTVARTIETTGPSLPPAYGASATDGGDGASDAGAGFDAGFEIDAGAQETEASQDLTVLFHGIRGPNVRVTRMRSDIAHTALGTDLVLRASADQGELSNQYNPGKEIGQPQCPVYNDSTCDVTGTVPRDQAMAEANGGCNTTPSRARSGSSLALFGIAGFLGLGVLRARRRRG